MAINYLLYDLPQRQAQHARAIQAGVPVLDWDTYVAALRNLNGAVQAFQSAIQAVIDFLDESVPQSERIGPLWFIYRGPQVEAAHELLDSADLPLLPSLIDCQFALAYGKSPRNPLARMNRKALELTRHAYRIQEVLSTIRSQVTAKAR